MEGDRDLCHALNLDRRVSNWLMNQKQESIKKADIISIVGGGGKTTTMLHLAKSLKDNGYRVVIGTTTAIYWPDMGYCDLDYVDVPVDNRLYNCEKVKKFNEGDNKGYVALVGKEDKTTGKIKGLLMEELTKLAMSGLFDYIILEADGAKERAVKAPRSHEPVLHSMTTMLIGCIGLSTLGKSMNEQWVHHPKVLSNLIDQQEGSMITIETYRRLINHPQGLFKGGESLRKILILNQMDMLGDDCQLKLLEELCRDLIKGATISEAIIGALGHEPNHISVVK